MEDSVFPSFLIAGVSDLLDLLDPVLKRSITTMKESLWEVQLTCCILYSAPIPGIILAVIANGNFSINGPNQPT